MESMIQRQRLGAFPLIILAIALGFAAAACWDALSVIMRRRARAPPVPVTSDASDPIRSHPDAPIRTSRRTDLGCTRPRRGLREGSQDIESLQIPVDCNGLEPLSSAGPDRGTCSSLKTTVSCVVASTRPGCTGGAAPAPSADAEATPNGATWFASGSSTLMTRPSFRRAASAIAVARLLGSAIALPSQRCARRSCRRARTGARTRWWRRRWSPPRLSRPPC